MRRFGLVGCSTSPGALINAFEARINIYRELQTERKIKTNSLFILTLIPFHKLKHLSFQINV